MIPAHYGKITVFELDGKIVADLTHDRTTYRHYLKSTPEDTERDIKTEALAVAREKGWLPQSGSLYWYLHKGRLTRNLEKPKRIQYSAIALDEQGRYVPDKIWGHEMPLLADGFETPEKAEERALGFFSDERVHGVMIRMSIQEYEGGGWKAGPSVKYVKRDASGENLEV